MQRLHCIHSQFLFNYTELENGDLKWELSGQMEMIDNPWKVIPSSRDKIPQLFQTVSGLPNTEKIHIANNAVVDWQMNLKKKRVSSTDTNDRKSIPFLQPSVQNRTLRDFFSHMAKMYNWQFTQSDLSGFEGSLAGVLKELYKQRLAEFVSTTF